MHKKSNAVFAFIFMLVLMTASVSFGVHRSWSQQKTELTESMAGLFEMLTARRETGSNILVVAKRHLDAQDEKIISLEKDIMDLGKNSSFETLAKANDRFEKDAQALLAKLKLQSSLRTDARDLMYAEQMLPQALEKSARMMEQAEYNELAQAFNKNLNKYFSGKIAQMLGIKPAQQFSYQEAAD